MNNFTYLGTRLCALTAVAFFMSACSPCIDNRGFNSDNTDFTKVKPGQTKEQVHQALGAPSSVATFRPLSWYYVTRKTSTTAFFSPRILEQQVFVVMFSPQEIVTETKLYTGNEAMSIVPVARKTETSGHESGVLREVFSNFGKISTQKRPR